MENSLDLEAVFLPLSLSRFEKNILLSSSCRLYESRMIGEKHD